MSKLLALYNNTKNAKELVYGSIFDVLSEAKNLKFIDDLQRERLETTGEYFTGEKIRTFFATGSNVYALYTIAMREKAGLPTNRVTLKFKGQFHKSIKSEIGNGKIIPTADFEKSDGNIGDNVDASKVLGWKTLEPIIEKMYPQIIAKIKVKLWK